MPELVPPTVSPPSPSRDADAGRAVPRRSLVLIGLMGAGKSAVGRRLAPLLGLPFLDADAEVERARGCTVAEIFARFGEPAFREAERATIAALLAAGPAVVATGGGAFLDPATREAIRARAASLWLRADLDVLFGRTVGRTTRPLLNAGDPRETLRRLMEARYPVYAEADIVVDTENVPIETTVGRVLAAVRGAAPDVAAAEPAR